MIADRDLCAYSGQRFLGHARPTPKGLVVFGANGRRIDAHEHKTPRSALAALARHDAIVRTAPTIH